MQSFLTNHFFFLLVYIYFRSSAIFPHKGFEDRLLTLRFLLRCMSIDIYYGLCALHIDGVCFQQPKGQSWLSDVPLLPD